MMKKKHYPIILFILLHIGLMQTDATSRRKAKYVWKVATLAPDGIGWAKFARDKFLKLIDERSNGEVAIDMYWGGVMGDDEDYIAKMRIGQLHGAGLSGAGTVMACPEMAVLELPFLFNGYNEVDYIRERLRTKISKIVEKNGYKMALWGDQDFDQIYSLKYEMRNPEDFRNSKFLTWYGALEVEVLKALGSSPIHVNVPEVVISMRSGLCNVSISPAIWWVGAQLYTITKYVNPLPIRYSPALVIVTQKTWNSIPLKYKKEFDESIIQFEKEFCEYIRESNKKCLQGMIDYGVKKVDMTSDEIEVFRKRTIPLWYKLAGKEYPKEILEEILYHLKECRKKAK